MHKRINHYVVSFFDTHIGRVTIGHVDWYKRYACDVSTQSTTNGNLVCVSIKWNPEMTMLLNLSQQFNDDHNKSCLDISHNEDFRMYLDMRTSQVWVKDLTYQEMYRLCNWERKLCNMQQISNDVNVLKKALSCIPNKVMFM